ncbi:S-layer homology domain-containing protein [Lawsonibacter asaccharolyticus]|uniref:S-layer homology domain-containing protein n=1 Tax=Lawsonibacter asaccharolyticus TaxID=2108523 RepID=UPI00265A5D7D|nr:S-layer homology domain-containing protein [Lawsonibacter asaccharolyticus]UMM47120.1 S-layer homology domain-containing protein [Lawsonibacter asaccharolyticus]
MRNLKRALSLALASVMLLGMMVVGSSAKGIDDFTDKAEIVNQDAVAVTSAIGMFEGYEDGSFGPENVVTRAEMAVIICTMLYGAGVNVNQFAETNVFTDVPAWAEGYVNLCSSLGIVAGVGEGKFDPNATVTTAQAVLMLCRALGYFQNAADFGDNWMLAATAKGTQLGLYGDLKLAANEGLTRDNVAELVFNALTKAVPVQYNELLGVYYNENKGILYSLTYYYTDTLGYKNFDLVYKTNENTDYGRPGTTWGIGSYRMDGNPSGEGNKEGVLNEDGSLIPERVKMTSDDEIITVADTPDFTYTANTKENVIYKAVGKSVVDDYTWNVYVDGDEQADPAIPANDKDTNYAYTAKGATTEIYVDDVNDTVTVVMINHYMAEVTKVKDGENTVRVLSNATMTNPIDERTIIADGFAKGDYVVVTVDVNDDDDSFIASIADPEAVEGTVTRVSKDSDPEGNQGSYVKMDDGSKHTYSKYTASDLDDINEEHPTLDISYRLYLDPNGYVIGFKALEGYYDNYLYVQDADVSLSTITAKVVFTDGTAKTVEIDDEYVALSSSNTKFDTNNDGKIQDAEITAAVNLLAGNVFAYTEDNGVYTLRQIVNMNATRPSTNRYKDTQDKAEDTGAGTVTINNDAAYIKANGTSYIVDEQTAFVDVDEKTLYTGFENVPDYRNGTGTDYVKFWAIDSTDDGVLDAVFIYGGVASNSNKTYFYVKDAGDFETYDKNKTYKEHNVYVDGEPTAMVFTQSAHNSVNAKGVYCVETTNGDGIVTSVTYIGTNTNGVQQAYTNDGVNNDFYTVKAVGSRSFSLNDANQEQLTVNNETVYVLATYDLKDNKSTYKAPSVGDGSLDDLKEDVKNDGDYFTYVYVAKTSNDGKTADLIFIEQWEKKPTVYSTVNYSAVPGTTLTVTANGQPVASGDKVANGTALTITATATDAANYDVTVKDQAGNTVTSPYTVNGNVTLTTVLTEKDKSVKVDLVFNQDAIVTIDGKEYLADQEISLLPGTYDFEAVYAGGVPAYAQAVAGDANVSVKTYGSAEKLIVTAAGTLTVGKETVALTLPANVEATFDGNTVNDGTSAGGNFQVLKNAVVTLGGTALGEFYTLDNGANYKAKGDTFTADEDLTVDAGYYSVTKAANATNAGTNGGVFSMSVDKEYAKNTETVTVTVTVVTASTDNSGNSGTDGATVTLGGGTITPTTLDFGGADAADTEKTATLTMGTSNVTLTMSAADKV